MKEKNKKDNLNQFDLDVYAGTIYGTSLPGKDKTKQEKMQVRSYGDSSSLKMAKKQI